MSAPNGTTATERVRVVDETAPPWYPADAYADGAIECFGFFLDGLREFARNHPKQAERVFASIEARIKSAREVIS